jgi:hypothetical protein
MRLPKAKTVIDCLFALTLLVALAAIWYETWGAP